jgi:dipeptidyl aminopeptidase/acylaminoacyl peptidase
MLTDISDGVAALATQHIIDPKRACIVGASYGGYAALAGVTIQHGLYRCSVAFAGVSDLVSFRNWRITRSGNDQATIRYWEAAFRGETSDGPKLDEISPAKHADQADAPVLLIHGKDDTVVPIEQSHRMEGALKGARKPVEIIELQGQDHDLSDEATRIQMLKASVAFVEKNNPPN